MATPFLGQLMAAGFNFAPKGWALCNGQTLAINQNQALFSLLGTTFGGNGVQNFMLPNLQGRIPLSFGQGPGLSNYNLGQIGGETALILAANQVPGHTHNAVASSSAPSVKPPSGGALASNVGMYTSGQTPGTAMNASSVVPAGGSQPHPNQQPFLVINWCIALTGIFPSQN
jgi:microcystin-dependent protein